MTIKEALLAELDELSVNQSTLNKILEDHALLADGTYDSGEHEKLIDLCLIDVYKKVLAKPDISEGGYSIRHGRNGLLQLIKALYAKWDLVDPDIPKVRIIRKG